MKYIFIPIRFVLGYIVIFVDWITRPSLPKHSTEKQAELDAATSKVVLYQFQRCPFCVKTRRTIRRLGLNVEKRDARNDPRWNAELISEGGKYQVPCLRITEDNGEVRWLYESTAINQYLDEHFALA